MSESFDPYKKWLGISPKDQPPHHYRLLGLELFESDPDVITTAADGRMALVKKFQSGQYSAVSQRLLNEIAAARIGLLNPEKKAQYDEALREKLKPAVKQAAPPPRARRRLMGRTAAGAMSIWRQSAQSRSRPRTPKPRPWFPRSPAAARSRPGRRPWPLVRACCCWAL